MSTNLSDRSPRRPSRLDGSPQVARWGPLVEAASFGSDGHADVPQRVATQMARLADALTRADEQLGHLRTALATNRRIGMAIGILMALRKVGEEEAFQLLRQASSHRNVKLRLVAEDVIRTGTLDSW